MMDGGGWGWMVFSMAVWTLVGLALLVLIVVAIVRLWPGGGPTFHASEPPRRGGKSGRARGTGEEDEDPGHGI